MTDLLPCPFCGGKAEHFELSWTTTAFGGHMYKTPFWQIRCKDCRATLGDFETEAEAIAAWNTRADTEYGAVAATEENMARYGWVRERTCHINELDALTQTLSMANGCAWGECSECGGLTPTDSAFCVECGAKVVGE